jgi:hypothetical protein
MDGTATIGVATTVAKADHVHPSDTTRALLAGSSSQAFSTAALTVAGGITSTAASNSLGATAFSGAITGGQAATLGATSVSTLTASGNIFGTTLTPSIDTGRFVTEGLRLTNTSGAGGAELMLMPSSASTSANFGLFNAYDPTGTNVGRLIFGVNGANASITAGAFGTGTAPNLLNINMTTLIATGTNSAQISPATTNIYYTNGTQNTTMGMANSANAIVTGSSLGDAVIRSTNNVDIAPSGTLIGTFSSTGLAVTGLLSATTKSFVIPHPTKPGMTLQYGSLESPYHGVRLTGEGIVSNGTCTINLPDYICGLVHQEGSQVQVTNRKHGKVLWVDEINVDQNYFVINTDAMDADYDFFWSFTGIRKDVGSLTVEY